MCGKLQTLFDPTPPAAQEGYHPPLLVDENGRLYVRLADGLSYSYDSVRTAPVVTGSQANVWANIANPGNVKSPAIDIGASKLVDIFGVSNGVANMIVYVSQDGITFYEMDQFPITAADFYAQFTIAARYVAVAPDAAVTLTVTIAGKG